jgi:hypothetical protein
MPHRQAATIRVVRFSVFGRAEVVLSLTLGSQGVQAWGYSLRGTVRSFDTPYLPAGRFEVSRVLWRGGYNHSRSMCR